MLFITALFSPPFAKLTVMFLAANAALDLDTPLSRSDLYKDTLTPFSTAVFALSNIDSSDLAFLPTN